MGKATRGKAGGLGKRVWPQFSRALPQEPYLQSQCGCCSYSLDPDSPVRILTLRCPGGRTEPVVLPAIRSCQCSACLGGSGRGRGQAGGGGAGEEGTGGAELPPPRRGRGGPSERPPFPNSPPPRDSSFLTLLIRSIPLLGSLVEFSNLTHAWGLGSEPLHSPPSPSFLAESPDLSLAAWPTMCTGLLRGLGESARV